MKPILSAILVAMAATVGVTDPQGTPIPNDPFTLRALVRPNSGGHDHDIGRPTGRFVTGADTTVTVQDRTDAAGERQYRYLSSGLGGVDSLFVQGETARDTASATIVLKIADFEELTEGSNYRLIGQTTTHRRNHYGTANTIKKLKMLADSAYADSTWVLEYNDISLMNGGPFDASSRHPWSTPHQTHREGRNVDLRPKSTDGRPLDVEWIRRVVTKLLAGSFLEESRGVNVNSCGNCLSGHT